MNTKQLKKEAAIHGRNLRPPAAGEYLGGVSVSTLAKWRLAGTGPRYSKLGPRLVIYDTRDLDAELDARKRRSTSESVEI